MNQPPQQSTLDDISSEVVRARKKFPGNRYLLAALMEEVGELSRAYLQKYSKEDIQNEAIQIACLAIRIIEEGDSIFNDVTEAEAKR